MTKITDYTYRFTAALDKAKKHQTATELLESLELNINKKDWRWSKLVNIIIEKQNEGYDFNQGRASLALLCQRVIDPIYTQFRVLAYSLPKNEINPAKTDLLIEGEIKNQPFRYLETIKRNAETAFPHILKNALCKNGFPDELDGVKAEDGKCTKLYCGENTTHQSLLYFRDHYREIGWRTVATAETPLEAISKASIEGYSFALNPWRNLFPTNYKKVIAYNALAQLRHFQKPPFGQDLML